TTSKVFQTSASPKGVYMGRKSVALLGLLSLSSVFPVRAQTSNAGSVTVNVVDPAGAVVPGATLQLKELSTNTMHEGETQSGGPSRFPDLPSAPYELPARREGFQKQVFQSIQVQPSRATTVKVEMEVGGTTQTVTVTAEATPLVGADSALASTI